MKTPKVRNCTKTTMVIATSIAYFDFGGWRPVESWEPVFGLNWSSCWVGKPRLKSKAGFCFWSFCCPCYQPASFSWRKALGCRSPSLHHATGSDRWQLFLYSKAIGSNAAKDLQISACDRSELLWGTASHWRQEPTPDQRVFHLGKLFTRLLARAPTQWPWLDDEFQASKIFHESFSAFGLRSPC